jgi:hypothetical protein
VFGFSVSCVFCEEWQSNILMSYIKCPYCTEVSNGSVILLLRLIKPKETLTLFL